MEENLTEGARENMAFQPDDHRVAVVRVDKELRDETQTGVYIVPLSRCLSEDEKFPEEDTGDGSMPLKNNKANSKQSRMSATTDNTERAGGTGVSNDIGIERPSKQDVAATVSETNKIPRKGTLLHFSNEGFEDDLPLQQAQAEIQGLIVRGSWQERRRKIMNKLRSKCIQIHCRCLGLGLVCLIILSLFLLPPSTLW